MNKQERYLRDLNLRKLRRQGMPVAEIAEQEGMSVKRVYQITATAQGHSEGKRDADIARRYQEGEGTPELAERYSLTGARVRQILEEQGVPRRAFTQKPQARTAAQAIIEAEGDLLVAHAAKEYGVGVTAIWSALAEHPEFDYTKAREGARRRMHAARARGVGKTICSECGEERKWSQMTKIKTKDGLASRSSRCKLCTSERAAVHYYKTHPGEDE